MRKRAAKGTGSLYRPKGRRIWVFKSPPGPDGKAVVISTGTADRKQAERIRRDHLEKMERGLSLDAHKVMFTDLAMDMAHNYQMNDRKTLKDLLFRFDRHILPSFGTLKASEITSADIARFIAKRKNERATNSEINRELSIIRRS
ncbi:MAG TPA: hypothetical protein VLH08_03075, partial [Acidobacteriota bacterium]|nr:hypothetical protein [Acidobacteriota bacterium]